jgi:hypothetical protein
MGEGEYLFTWGYENVVDKTGFELGVVVHACNPSTQEV